MSGGEDLKAVEAEIAVLLASINQPMRPDAGLTEIHRSRPVRLAGDR